MQIQHACKCDLPEILQLQYLAYQSEAKLLGRKDIPPLKQTLEEVTRELEKGMILKAVDSDNTIIGSVRAYCKGGTAYIGKLIVHPQRQGQGIGTRLLKEIELQCCQGRYELFTSSKSARNLSLYERAGYRRFREEEAAPGLIFLYLEKQGL